MPETEKRPKITDYQPTSEELEMLEEAGLTLQEVLEFNQPTEEELKALQEAGTVGLVGAILGINLKGNILEAIAQLDPYTFSIFSPKGIDDKIKRAQKNATEKVALALSGNPYPGKDFSKAQGEQALALMESQSWDKSNLASGLRQIRDILGIPNPQVQPTPGK